MRPSQVLAVAAYLLVVPGCIWLAYAGSRAGVYPYAAIPIAFGVAFAVATVALLAALPAVRRRLE